MKRTVCLVLTVFFLLLPGSLGAVSMPVVQGVASGIELCPQFICQAAIFVAQFNGRVGQTTNAVGYIAVAATHEPLPDPGLSSDITGGQWELNTIRRDLAGVVAGGTLYNNGNNTYTVNAALLIVRGGAGVVFFEGLLDHRVFPPTIQGTLRQTP